MTEVRQSVIITNDRGLHARASAKFVNHVSKLDQDVSVYVEKDGNHVTGGSIMGLMMLGAAKGDKITIIVNGPHADASLERLVGLVRDGFGED